MAETMAEIEGTLGTQHHVQKNQSETSHVQNTRCLREAVRLHPGEQTVQAVQ